MNDWAKSRNLSRPTDVDFLDLAKAFDSVPHERLLLKLKSNGIDGRLHAWLRHFLTGRRQRVILRGTTIMDKILGTVVQFERFSTLFSTPPPTPQTVLKSSRDNSFDLSTLYWVGRVEGTWICKKTALLFATELVKRIELKLRSDCPKDFCP